MHSSISYHCEALLTFLISALILPLLKFRARKSEQEKKAGEKKNVKVEIRKIVKSSGSYFMKIIKTWKKLFRQQFVYETESLHYKDDGYMVARCNAKVQKEENHVNNVYSSHLDSWRRLQISFLLLPTVINSKLSVSIRASTHNSNT